jgi:hypothetical protein
MRASAVAKVKPATVFVADLIQHRVGGDQSDPVRLIGYAAPEAALYVAKPEPELKLPAPAVITIEYCIDETGHVTVAHWSRDEIWDSRIGRGAVEPREIRLAINRVKDWRFAPYFVDGRPTRACSQVDVRTDVEYVHRTIELIP